MSPAVLTYFPAQVPLASRRSPIAYRCEATAHALSSVREVLLATYRGGSARLAARWLRAEARHLARLLGPDPTAPPLERAPLVDAGPDAPDPDSQLRAWADSGHAYEHALHVLASGRAYVFSVTDYDARYSLQVYPLPTRQRPQPYGVGPCPHYRVRP